MKKLILLYFLFLIGFNSNVFTQGFEVTDYFVEVFISEEGYFDIEEHYTVYFFEEKHGLLRNIPIKHYIERDPSEKPEKRRIIISNIDVPGHPFSKPSALSFKYSDEIELKIGDKNKYVIEEQKYTIKYRVENGFIFSGDYAQFYWNIKPAGWQSPFYNVKIKVYAPDGVSFSSQNSFLYSGYNSSTPSSEFTYEYNDNTFYARSLKNFRSNPGESVTVLLKMPKEFIKEVDYSLPWWQKYSWVAIVFVIGAGIKGLWKQVGQPDEVVATTSYYPPKGMDSAIAGFVIDDSANNSDLISLLPYWGIKGLIKIKDIPKQGILSSTDVEITRINQLPSDAQLYEKIIFDGLFENGDTVLVSSLKEKFYVNMDKAKRELEKQSKIYYENDINKKSSNVGCFSGIFSIIIGVIFLYQFSILAAITSTIVLIGVSSVFFNLKKNSLGREVYSELLGFREFIKIAEINKIKMLLEDDPDYFENTMCYAVAFDLLKSWSKKFDELGIEPPDWYSSNAGVASMGAFGNSFSNNMSTASSNFVSSPSTSSSGGGGSSGGGMGGGGGGSW